MVTDDAVVAAMERYGGSFVVALAACWRRADDENRRTLRGAFTATWANYAELAERAAGRQWSGLMAGFTPAPTDRTTTTTGDTGGPTGVEGGSR
jgi:hypothetical protein